jgi:hypothetical protein
LLDLTMQADGDKVYEKLFKPEIETVFLNTIW